MNGRSRRFGSRARPRMLVAVLALGVAGSALFMSTAGAAPAPEGLPDFYATPNKLPSKPGTLIKAEKVSAPDIDGTVYRVMYVSENQRGKPAAVTGVVVVPEGSAPKGGFPVVSWAHGTNGMADQCAPSLEPEDTAPSANVLLAEGWAVTASDLEGEGTPGLHPYIAGKNAARNTIDIVRAAKQLKAAGGGKVKLSDDYVVWGHSQGGHTVMHVSQLAPEYAPELHLKGTAAGAPPSQFNLLYNFLKTSEFRYYLLMASGGLNAAYGDDAAPLDEVLTPAGVKLIPELEKTCASGLREQFGTTDFDTVSKIDPFTVPKWQKILAAEDPQNFAGGSEAPVLIIHGGDDEQIPTASSALLFDQLCAVGQNLERWVYPGQRHADVIAPSLPDMIQWIDHRFAATGSETTPDAMTPTGQPDIEVKRCPA